MSGPQAPREQPGDEGRPQRPCQVLRYADGAWGAAGQTDQIAVEEPLEVRLGERSLLVTMRTPGDDLDLVRGLLFTEGLVDHPGDVVAVAWCREVPAEARGNVVQVSLARGVSLREERTARAGVRNSACGVCGQASLEAIAQVCDRVAQGPIVTLAALSGLPAAMRDQQRVFGATGGLHAAALFDPAGAPLAFAEDVGRHNAVDKVVGQALRFGRLPLGRTLLMVSGRAGFEIVQKARRAGIPVVCSVSAPSSLAIDLAKDGGQTLVGFLRGGRFNVYAGPERLAPARSPDLSESCE